MRVEDDTVKGIETDKEPYDPDSVKIQWLGMDLAEGVDSSETTMMWAKSNHSIQNIDLDQRIDKFS